MGSLISNIRALFAAPIPKRILMIGLDAAGKTTILYKINLGEIISTVPTIGFNVETVKCGNLEATIWDVGGQAKIRPLWKHYYQGLDGLIYVVDSNDRERIETAKEELQVVLSDDLLNGVPLLVFANKQDMSNALSCKDIVKELNLYSYGSTNNINYTNRAAKNTREWYCQASSALSGDGLYEGFEWLSKVTNKK